MRFVGMDLTGYVIWMLLMCCIIISHGNDGVQAKRLSRVEDLQITKQLELINKPAVEIIKTIHGELYGCVDFYKQPGFDDPLLKDHTFHQEMRPKLSQRKASTEKSFGYLWENGVGCPNGTVPIKRVTKDELIRMNSLGQIFNTSQTKQEKITHHYALLRTKEKGAYNGASMRASVHGNPTINGSTRFSACRMNFKIGDDFMVAGWIVHPGVFSDSKTRFFIFTKAGQEQCWNNGCSAGMILVRQDTPPGLVFDKLSIRNDEPEYKVFAILKDQNNGNWWLSLDGIDIGFWPANKFQANLGTEVEWGGEVYSESDPFPSMGNGFLPEGFPRLDSTVSQINVVDDQFKWDNTLNNTEGYATDKDLYNVRVMYDSIFPKLARHVFYGGPAGTVE